MALVHAIRNAQDATPDDGSIEVLLGTTEVSVTIKITDTGAGMDEAFVRERLFKPFDSTKGTQGVGIGAYQIKETMHSLGGRVQVHSTPGSGTEVTLLLSAASEKV
jgi:signal transduction histidine kinase